jgi:hypothetical protein
MLVNVFHRSVVVQTRNRWYPARMPHLARCLAILAILAFSLSAAPARGQILIQNPSLPAEESAVYTEKVGNDTWTVTQTLSLKSENGESWYEFRSSSPESDVSIRLDPATLFPRASEVITKSGDSVIRRTTEILKAAPHPRPNELVIADFNSLPVTLRGLPWGTFTTVSLVALGASSRGQQFSFQLTVAGKETVSAGGKTYDCWKAQLGLGGFMGAFFGKSSYWFSADAPHFLVKSEGPSGGPGFPIQKSELQSYSSKGT